VKKLYEQNYGGVTFGPLRLSTAGITAPIWSPKTVKPLHLGSSFPDCQASVRVPGYSYAEAKDLIQYMKLGLESSAKYAVGSDRSTGVERFARTLTAHMNLAKKPAEMESLDLGESNGWARFELSPLGGAHAAHDKLATIRSAVRSKTTLRFLYRNARGTLSTRRVLPSGLYISAEHEVFFTAQKLLRRGELVRRSYRLAQAEAMFTENLKQLTPELTVSFVIENGDLTTASMSDDECPLEAGSNE